MSQHKLQQRHTTLVWNFANATSYESLTSYTRKSLPPVEKKAKAKTNEDSGSLCEPTQDKQTKDKQTKEKTYAQQKWLSAFDLNRLVAGCGEVFDHIGIDVAQKVVSEFVNKRTQFKKAKLRFRASGGAKRALGWVPFKALNIRQKGNSLTFLGKRIRLFKRSITPSTETVPSRSAKAVFPRPRWAIGISTR